MDRLYTPHELADMLQMNYRKILDLILLGELNAFKIGRVYRISESDFQTFLNDNSMGSS